MFEGDDVIVVQTEGTSGQEKTIRHVAQVLKRSEVAVDTADRRAGYLRTTPVPINDTLVARLNMVATDTSAVEIAGEFSDLRDDGQEWRRYAWNESLPRFTGVWGLMKDLATAIGSIEEYKEDPDGHGTVACGGRRCEQDQICQQNVCRAERQRVSAREGLRLSDFSPVPDTVSYLSKKEWNLLKATNEARTQPDSLAERLTKWRAYYDGKIRNRPNHFPIRTTEGVSALNEAIRFLRSVEPRAPLKPSRGLSKAAQDHATYQKETGEKGHEGRNGSGVYDRASQYGYATFVGENIAYGDKTGREMLIQLIIDDGVPSRGHRINIFREGYRHIGIGCDTHPQFDGSCVMDLAGQYDTAKSQAGKSKEN